MKFKNFAAGAVAAGLLFLFLPVFYHVIFYGNNMNYNPEHKIYALYGNKVLLALVFVGIMVFGGLVAMVRKIPANKSTVWGFVGITMVAGILFYMLNVEIAKCIAFYGGWDCGMVAKSAVRVYEGKDLGYGDYYYIFTNNLPVTWLLNRLYEFASGISGYAYNTEFIWIQFQCAVHGAAIFFSGMTALLISGDVGLSGLVFVVNAIVLTLSPWKIIPYTDASTIGFPIVTVFLYAVFLRMKSRWRYGAWLGMAFLGALGGIFKATCYVMLIAIVMIDFVWMVCEKGQLRVKAGNVLLRCGLLAGGLFLAGLCKNGMYQTLGYEYNENLDIGWQGFLYDGLNEESTGACSEDGLNIVREFADRPRQERDAYVMEGIRDRITEKGFGGLLDFWMRKQVMTYNDGTFSWYQEGFFHAKEYEDITDSSFKEPLRSFYWQEGDNYLYFVTFSHGIWLFILVGIILEAAQVLLEAVFRWKNCKGMDEGEVQVRAVLLLAFIGVFLFLMLFEGRARYLYNTISVFVVMAVMGYYKMVEKIIMILQGIKEKVSDEKA